jgi:hypothetical protein
MIRNGVHAAPIIASECGGKSHRFRSVLKRPASRAHYGLRRSIMKKGTVRSSLVVLAAAALSTLAITCRTTDALGPTARTVELRQVQQFATVFNKVIDQAIANRSGGGLAAEFVDICPDRPIFRAHRDMIAQRVNIVRTGAAIDPPVQFTVDQLRELRALVNLRVDEAFQAGSDTSAYKDILSVQLGKNGISGTVAAPRASVQIRGAQ